MTTLPSHNRSHSRDEDRLVALITGANRGIGLETARQLGGRGITVLLGARDAERGAEAAAALRGEGLDAHHVLLDVTDPASVDAAATTIRADHGRLDILVNNAAISGSRWDPPSATAPEVLRQVIETNVVGVVVVTNALLPLLRAAPAGRIVNVSSEVGSITANLDPTSPLWPMAGIPYPVSKAALDMVTAMYAKELWSTPVKVNAANPGWCATDFNGNSGFRSAAEGAEAVVHLATLDATGPSGQFYGFLWTESGEGGYGELPW